MNEAITGSHNQTPTDSNITQSTGLTNTEPHGLPLSQDIYQTSPDYSGNSSAVGVDQYGKSGNICPSWSGYFRAEVDTRWSDLILILCGFVGGLVDGLAFNAWGNFASMQTGNTVFVALGVSGQPAYPAYLWAKSLISVATFVAGNIFFIHASRFLGALRRSTLIASFALQTSALFITVILVQIGVIDSKPEDPRAPIQWMQVIAIALLAFQAAGQIVASRVLAFDEIPTVVLTTLLCDLLVDPKLYARPWKANPKRNRRVGAFLALFLGAMTAGGLVKVSGMSTALWVASALKAGITVSWFFWRERVTTGCEEV
ncbi:conserved hypothetical protein [Paecilomyces variotii No. 5]|uniref:DUF1275 domain protein n=1 Tax=Byssochlamys spectabilis (strain No. 5 / NBRC 109023) TaxID=1356009 RepID=V5I629_BYSSN|nr:conserved hypothetical protein [Paecilomyces variotii No. 5]